MVAFTAVNVGDRLYDCHRTRMGNTTISQMGCWPVDVLEIDRKLDRARVRWNGNSSQWWSAHRIKQLRRSPIKGAR